MEDSAKLIKQSVGLLTSFIERSDKINEEQNSDLYRINDRLRVIYNNLLVATSIDPPTLLDSQPITTLRSAVNDTITNRLNIIIGDREDYIDKVISNNLALIGDIEELLRKLL